MSRMFLSKVEALNFGFGCAGRDDLFRDSVEAILDIHEVTISNQKIHDFSVEELSDQLIVNFPNSKGKIVTMGTCKFREGYDLWLFGERGFCTRV